MLEIALPVILKVILKRWIFPLGGVASVKGLLAGSVNYCGFKLFVKYVFIRKKCSVNLKQRKVSVIGALPDKCSDNHAISGSINISGLPLLKEYTMS